MPSYRAERIGELILREVSVLLPRVKDPRLVPISITRVVVAKDLSHAVIEYLPLGGGAASQELIDALKGASKAIRGPVGRALGIRHSPELVFRVDDHTEAAVRVSTLLEKIGRELNPPAPKPEEESDIDEEEGA